MIGRGEAHSLRLSHERRIFPFTTATCSFPHSALSCVSALNANDRQIPSSQRSASSRRIMSPPGLTRSTHVPARRVSPTSLRQAMLPNTAVVVLAIDLGTNWRNGSPRQGW